MDENAMDVAAAAAKVELKKLVDEGEIDRAVLMKVAAWYGRNFMKAGHKRLGRLMAAISKDGQV